MARRRFEREDFMTQGIMNPFAQELESIRLRKDANDSINNATDQYEADVADFKSTQANEFEQGLASLLEQEPIFTPPPIFRDEPPIFTPPGNPYQDIFRPPFEPPIDRPPFRPPFEPPYVPPIDGPPDVPPFEPPIDRPPYVPPIDEPPFRPPFDPPIDGPPDVPPFDPPPPPPPPPPSGPINPYTGKPVNNPYTPYSTDSGAAPLTRAITPRDFGQAPGFERPIGGPPIILPPAPPRPPIEPPIMCFVAGTKVDMADGTKKVIENIAMGDEVLALNGEKDVVSYVHDIPKADRSLWTINDRITATDAHAFLTEDGWKSNNAELSNTVYNEYGINIKDLQLGDKLITNDGVEEVTKLENEKDFVKVYNFTTSNTHTYMVDGVVSHNKQPPGRPPILFSKKEPDGMKNGGGISMLPMNGQGDTMTTQMFQRAFRPRR